jgi:alkanesulfonate monooxygenase SsuD/methylene tetrahydromethanopterin reductase-like flavin-dependent oxidoreductase (luciferase family)
MSRANKITLVVLGSFVLFMGVVLWTAEDQYGHGLDFTLKGRFVYEAGTDAPVFEGSPEEAREYMERERAEGERNFVMPGLVIAAGLAAVIAAFLPWHAMWRRSSH